MGFRGSGVQIAASRPLTYLTTFKLAPSEHRPARLMALFAFRAGQVPQSNLLRRVTIVGGRSGSIGDSESINEVSRMNTSNIVIAFAVLAGPLIAVQVQKWLEEFREKRKNKQLVFATLMRTRAARVSPEHVQALNAIEIVFFGKKKKDTDVVTGWRTYLDHLNVPHPKGVDEEIRAAKQVSWAEESDRLFIELLKRMADALGYKFDRVTLKRSCYSPRAEGEREDDFLKLRQFLGKLATWKAALPIVAFPPPDTTGGSPQPVGEQNSAGESQPTGDPYPAGELDDSDPAD